MKINYEWLETFFGDGVLPSVDDVEQKLVFHAYEVEGVEDVGGTKVLDIDVLPNRAADSLSHRGIAHEVAALFDVEMKRDPLREEISLEPTTEEVKVTLAENASCSYYAAALVSGVKVGESPDWLKQRLEAIGQKSINNVVDATNYVMFEIGRPTHVFDAKKFDGDIPHVGTRLAKQGERMTLLGGEDVELSDSMTLIIDVESDTPVAIGGVKGGAHAEVEEDTTEVLIETANFHPKQTRLTAQALKLRTDASTRFENNLADKLVEYGVVGVAQLIAEIAGGEIKGYAHAGTLDTAQPEVAVTAGQASKLLGAEIDADTIEDILERIGCSVTRDGDAFMVTAPFVRRDIQIREDVIEEIGRVYGYNKIESKQLEAPEKEPAVNKKFAYTETIRGVLATLGFTEVYLYSLRDSGKVKLLNALASDKDHARGDLASGLTESLDKNEKNMPLLGLHESIKLFEIGNVFLKDKEETRVALGVRVPGNKKKEERAQEQLRDAKKTMEDTLDVVLPEPQSEFLEFSLDDIVEQLPDPEAYPETNRVTEGVVYEAASQYPFVLRDIAVWVSDDTNSDEVLAIVQQHSGDLLVRADLFDEFEKDGKKSYAFHLVFQSKEETLTDEKVGSIMSAIEEDIALKKDWQIR